MHSASAATFDLGATWGQTADRQNSSSAYVDEAMARATFQALLLDTTGVDSSRRQEEEKQLSSQPHSRTHNSYAPPPSRTTFLSSTSAIATPSHSALSATSDSGLISALTQRVHTLEALAQQQSKQLAAKEQQLLHAQAEHDLLLAASQSPSSAAATPATTSELQLLRRKSERLLHQVGEMEKFLSDYGLQWIGDSTSTLTHIHDAQSGALSSTSSATLPSSASTALPFHLPTLLQRVEQLNASLPPTSLLIGQQSSVTRFQPPPYLLLTLYRDGLTLTQSNHREQPLRAYDSPPARALLDDVLDGFFPSEWRAAWPDGVRVVVADCSAERWEEVARRRRRERRQRSWHAFEGAGRRVRETPEWRQQVRADEEAERAAKEEQRQRQQRVKEAFLSRLPATTVTAAGQLVEVKAMVQRVADGDSRDVTPAGSVWQRVEVKDSDTLALLRSTAASVQPPFSPALGVCTLHVHVQHTSASDDAAPAQPTSFLLLLQSHHTLSALMALLQRHVLAEPAERRARKWRLHWASLQPRVVVEMEEMAVGAASSQTSCGRVDEKTTLAAAGWKHNCSLFVHLRSL